MIHESFIEAFELNKELIDEQIANAESLIQELIDLGLDEVENITVSAMLDALATIGLQLVDISGSHNIPSLAFFRNIADEQGKVLQ